MTALALAGCVSESSDVHVFTGGSFGPTAAVIGSFSGEAGRSAVIGGTGPAPIFSEDYGAYDYRTRSFGGDGFRTRCVGLSTDTGHCAVWIQS